MRAWIDGLERHVPGGVGKLLGEDVTVEGIVRLVAGFIYLGSVEHEVLGTGLWDYQLWTHVQPTRIYRSGRRESVDVFQRLVNYNFILNVRRSPLCADFSHTAHDQEGKRAFRAFLADLQALQEKLDAASPPAGRCRRRSWSQASTAEVPGRPPSRSSPAEGSEDGRHQGDGAPARS